MQIIGRNLADVEKVLGKIESSEMVKPSRTPCKPNGCLKGYFDNGGCEIVFIEGVADWITLNNTNNLAIAEFISYWGLEQIKPDFSNPDLVLRYYNVYGMKEVAIFKTI